MTTYCPWEKGNKGERTPRLRSSTVCKTRGLLASYSDRWNLYALMTDASRWRVRSPHWTGLAIQEQGCQIKNSKKRRGLTEGEENGSCQPRFARTVREPWANHESSLVGKGYYEPYLTHVFCCRHLSLVSYLTGRILQRGIEVDPPGLRPYPLSLEMSFLLLICLTPWNWSER